MRRFVLAVPLVTLVAPVHAADDPKVTEGRKHFQRGVELYAEGDFRGALIEFQRAHQIAPSFRILYNIGKANLELLDWAAALQAFERYLAEGGVDVPADKRTEVEAEIGKLRQRVAWLSIDCNVSGADVTIDDAPAGKTPLAKEIVVGIGRHKVVVQLPGQAPMQSTVDVAGGDHTAVKAWLEPAPKPAAPPPPPIAPAPASRTGMWIGVAATSTLLVTTGVFGVLTLQAHQSFSSAADSGPMSSSDVDDRVGRIRTFRLLTDVFGAATLVAGGATLYFALSSEPGRATTKIGVVPGALLIEGRF